MVPRHLAPPLLAVGISAALILPLCVSGAFQITGQTYHSVDEICQFYTGWNRREGHSAKLFKSLFESATGRTLSASNDVSEWKPPSLRELQLVQQLIEANAVRNPVEYLEQQSWSTGEFPRLIHMTVRTKQIALLTDRAVLSIASWIVRNPQHKILLYDDDDVENYVRHFLPAHLPLLQSLRLGVQRADLIRHLVLCGHGGVYADADTLCMQSVDSWNAENGYDAKVLIGLESILPRHSKFELNFNQWALASVPEHELFCSISDRIQKLLSTQEEEAIQYKSNITGPSMFTRHVKAYIERSTGGMLDLPQIAEGGVFGSVRVLPPQAIGCHLKFFSGHHRPGIYLYHGFFGSWAKQRETY